MVFPQSALVGSQILLLLPEGPGLPIDPQILQIRLLPQRRHPAVEGEQGICLVFLAGQIDLTVVGIHGKPWLPVGKSSPWAVIPLHRGSGMLPGFHVQPGQGLPGADSLLQALLIEPEGGKIPELADLFLPVIGHAYGLALVEKRNSPQKEVHCSQHGFTVIIHLLRRIEPFHHPWCVMILHDITWKRPVPDPFLHPEHVVPAGRPHLASLPLPVRCADPVTHAGKVKHGGEISVFPDILLQLVRAGAVDLTDDKCVPGAIGPVLHLLKELPYSLHIGAVGKGILPLPVILEVLFQMVDGIHAKAADPLVQPAVQHCIYLFPHPGILPVKIRLPYGEQVQVVMLCVPDPLPGASAEKRPPSIGRASVLPPADHIIIPIGSFRVFQCLLKPGMLCGSVVHHHIHQYPDPPFPGFPDQLLKILHGPEGRVDGIIIGNIISPVHHGGTVHRTQPENIDPQPDKIIQMGRDPRKIPDSIVIRILEALWIHLIANGTVPPFLFHGRVLLF